MARGPNPPVSPAIQLRALLAESREFGIEFEAAWEYCIERVKWPHDTAHRVEWKAVLGVERAPGMSEMEFFRLREQTLTTWRAAYELEPVRPREEPLAALVA